MFLLFYFFFHNKKNLLEGKFVEDFNGRMLMCLEAEKVDLEFHICLNVYIQQFKHL